jgi:hypothetical protein
LGLNPNVSSMTGVIKEGMYQIELYQAIRDCAQDKANFYKGFLGAISVYALPVAYALLGASLYALRWSKRIRRHQTDQLPDRISRFLIAGIVGIAVSAFSALIPGEVSLSPPAIAFILGYSIDVFISHISDRCIYYTFTNSNSSLTERASPTAQLTETPGGEFRGTNAGLPQVHQPHRPEPLGARYRQPSSAFLGVVGGGGGHAPPLFPRAQKRKTRCALD